MQKNKRYDRRFFVKKATFLRLKAVVLQGKKLFLGYEE
jgi:hypothetical protein